VSNDPNPASPAGLQERPVTCDAESASQGSPGCGGTGERPGGLEDQARLITWHVGAWNDLGYPQPLPLQGAHPIPPPGQRSAGNIKAGHGVIEAIGELIRDLHALRAQIVTEIRADQDARTIRQCHACPAPASCSESGHCTSEQAPAAAAARKALRAQLAGLAQDRPAREQTARACACPPGLCSARGFRDHTGDTDPPGCPVCAGLNPGQPCYGAVRRGLRAPAGR
jgi:hypothetical protein